MNYIAILHKDADSEYGVSFPDFPGCVTAGATLEEASAMAKEALEFHIDGMIEEGQEIPAPSKLDDIAADVQASGGIAFMVSVTKSAKTVRVNISVRADALEEIDARAASAGMDRSSYMVSRSVSERQSERTAEGGWRVRSKRPATKKKSAARRA